MRSTHARTPFTLIRATAAPQQILDKEEYTLEELLDEDDVIQECKSLNGRLIALCAPQAEAVGAARCVPQRALQG